jgi:hypothetical protein
MSIFQLIALLFALFMLYIVRIHSRKQTLGMTETSVWTSIWLLFAVLSLFPGLLSGISDTLNFARVFDLLVVAAFMVVTYLTFSNYLANKKMLTRFDRLVRDQAIKSAKDKSGK